jgi:hypothetical protein
MRGFLRFLRYFADRIGRRSCAFLYNRCTNTVSFHTTLHEYGLRSSEESEVSKKYQKCEESEESSFARVKGDITLNRHAPLVSGAVRKVGEIDI